MEKYKKIFGNWYEIVRPFIESEDFKSIGRKLKKDHDLGIRIYPLFDEVFRAFQECSYEDLNVVMLTSNAYVAGEMDGLAFSNPKARSSEEAPLLRKMFDGIEQDVTRGLYLNRNYDLTRWANQGILLLNCDLTTEKNKPGSHLELWKPFIEYLMTMLVQFKPGTSYCLFGKVAQKYINRIDLLANDVYVIEHPQQAVVLDRPWKHRNIFSDINRVNKFINNKEIEWT